MKPARSIWFQVALFVITRTVINISLRMVYPFLPVFSRGMGVSLQDISLALTARSLSGMLTPFLASFADHYGRKTGMLAGLALFVIGVTLVVLWPGYPAFFAALILTVVSGLILFPSIQAYVGDQVPYQQRGLVIALTELGWSISFIAGIPLVGLVIARYGWQAPFPLLAVAGLVGLALLAVFIPPTAPHRLAGGSRERFRLVFTSGTALAGMAMGTAIMSANESVNLVFGVWMEDSFGLQIAALGAASAVIGASELGGEVLTAGLVDRLGKERSVRLGLLLNTAAALALPVIGRTLPGSLVALFLFYLTFEFTVVSSLPLISELMPRARATMMGLSVAASSLGRAFGALIAPWLYENGIWSNALAAAVLNLVAILLLSKVKIGPNEDAVDELNV